MGAQNPEFFTNKGIKEGTALRFIRDIPEWSGLQGDTRVSEMSGALADDGLE
jgi:hypothetical protein